MARVPTTDPGLPLNCPRCGYRLIFTAKITTAYIYICPDHGEYHLCEDGHLRGGDGPYGKPKTPRRPN